MSDQDKKETIKRDESLSKVILNLHDRISDSETAIDKVSTVTKHFSDAIVNYCHRNDKNIDKFLYFHWFHFIIEAVLVWMVFFK